MKLHGVISDRLRKLFAAGDAAWTPQRPGPPPTPPPVPKGVDGQSLGGRRGKHRDK